MIPVWFSCLRVSNPYLSLSLSSLADDKSVAGFSSVLFVQVQQIRQCTDGTGGHAAFASIMWSPPINSKQVRTVCSATKNNKKGKCFFWAKLYRYHIIHGQAGRNEPNHFNIFRIRFSSRNVSNLHFLSHAKTIYLGRYARNWVFIFPILLF